MNQELVRDIRISLEELKEQGLYKSERIIISAQGPEIQISSGETVLNLCSNNYLGLSNHPEVIKAAQEIMNDWGFGLSSVRFICGTQKIHKDLEYKMSEFLGTEDTILYCACFDANGGVFEPLLGAESAVISDELNHASIIDGIRLCKARRFRYKHSCMEDLENCLKEAADAKYKLIVTDGIFSMDGDMAKLPEIVKLAEKYGALVLVDDSHATGYIGDHGRGTAEYYGLEGKIDIITTTFGKALGGGNGGCTSGKWEIIEMLRQRSRPYLFSNTLAPATVGATLKVLEILAGSNLPAKTVENAHYFRSQMERAGFDLVNGNSAIIPVMVYDEPLAVKFADELLKEGIYVTGFCYPVVPRGKARVRVQLSAAHTIWQMDKAVEAFIKTANKLSII